MKKDKTIFAYGLAEIVCKLYYFNEENEEFDDLDIIQLDYMAKINGLRIREDRDDIYNMTLSILDREGTGVKEWFEDLKVLD